MEIDLSGYQLIAVSTSAGKDSEAMIIQMAEMARRQGVFHRLAAIHSSTGAEWTCTQSVAKKIANLLSIPLYTVYPKWTITDYIEHRLRFPDLRRRFCTSLKTEAIDKWIQQLFPAKETAKILSVTGERHEESTHRAKLAEFERCERLSAGNREVFHYRPMLEYETGEIWTTIRESGLPYHPAYDLGNCRLSYALCVFACDRDLRNGARDRPDLARRYLELEEKTGFLFRCNRSLKDILAKEAA